MVQPAQNGSGLIIIAIAHKWRSGYSASRSSVGCQERMAGVLARIEFDVVFRNSSLE